MVLITPLTHSHVFERPKNVQKSMTGFVIKIIEPQIIPTIEQFISNQSNLNWICKSVKKIEFPYI